MKNSIENEIGSALYWDRLDERRASRISISIPFVVNDSDVETAPIIQWGVEMMVKFIDTFQPRIRKL